MHTQTCTLYTQRDPSSSPLVYSRCKPSSWKVPDQQESAMVASSISSSSSLHSSTLWRKNKGEKVSKRTHATAMWVDWNHRGFLFEFLVFPMLFSCANGYVYRWTENAKEWKKREGHSFIFLSSACVYIKAHKYQQFGKVEAVHLCLLRFG